MIPTRTVSPPVFAMRALRLPLPFTLPPMTLEPAPFVTGRDSPVTMLSFTCYARLQRCHRPALARPA
jgi:hypothetical protein